MNTITIHPESEKQENLLKSLFEELKIKFEISKKEEIIKLSDFEKELIQQGLDDVKAGKLYSSEEAEKMIEECFK